MSQFQKNKAQTFRFASEVEAAFIVAPILLFFCVLGLFINHDYAMIPYIIRFVLLIITGYLGAQRLHRRWKYGAKQHIYNKMVPTGMRAGFYAAAMAWGITILFMVIASIIDMNMEASTVAGLLSAVLDIGAGFLLGSLGGWIYSKINRPQIMH